MNRCIAIFTVLFSILSAPYQVYSQSDVLSSEKIPAMLVGTFIDDYGIKYEINDTLWTQFPGIRYNVISWNIDENYLLALNDDKNISDSGLYTRIDYMTFENMEPYTWGFCLTTYNAETVEEARDKAVADRENPKIGCNGHPFSRMRRLVD